MSEQLTSILQTYAAEIRGLRRRVVALEGQEQPAINRGTGFPSGWPTLTPFFRTDLGWWCYDDGTRWLTEDEYTVAGPDTTLNVSPSGYAYGNIRQAYAPYITRVVTQYLVSTTNNGSNYWTVTVRAASASFATATVHQFTTAAGSANTWYSNDSAPSATSVPGTTAAWDTIASATGAPGALRLWNTVYYRFIIP